MKFLLSVTQRVGLFVCLMVTLSLSSMQQTNREKTSCKECTLFALAQTKLVEEKQITYETALHNCILGRCKYCVSLEEYKQKVSYSTKNNALTELFMESAKQQKVERLLLKGALFFTCWATLYMKGFPSHEGWVKFGMLLFGILFAHEAFCNNPEKK